MNLIQPSLTTAQITSINRLVPLVTKIAPTTGQTVAPLTGSVDSTVFIAPAGTLATLTVTIPADGSSTLGDVVTISTTKLLTVLTISGAATILGGVVALAANESVSYKKTDTDTWVRLT